MLIKDVQGVRSELDGYVEEGEGFLIFSFFEYVII